MSCVKKSPRFYARPYGLSPQSHFIVLFGLHTKRYLAARAGKSNQGIPNAPQLAKPFSNKRHAKTVTVARGTLSCSDPLDNKKRIWAEKPPRRKFIMNNREAILAAPPQKKRNNVFHMQSFSEFCENLPLVVTLVLDRTGFFIEFSPSCFLSRGSAPFLRFCACCPA
jgi:hypothetical protein